MSEPPQAISKTPSMTSNEHPLSAAARAGYGPLSERGKESWHGNSTPCASWGQLKMREAGPCPHCAQDLGKAMLEKMAKHSGPWFVYDSVRPFPGVSLERMASLARRGALQRASIVRGPTTYYQWRFASETPRNTAKSETCHSMATIAEINCWSNRSRILKRIARRPPSRPNWWNWVRCSTSRGYCSSQTTQSARQTDLWAWPR